MDTEAENRAVERMIVDGLSDDADEEIVYKQGFNNRNGDMESGEENAPAPLRIPVISGDIRADCTILNSDGRILDRLENLNKKLIDEIADTKLSEESYIKEYEHEREQCKILQKRCGKMEKLLAASKAKLDESVQKSEEYCEEVDRLDSAVRSQRGEMYTKLENVQETLINKCMELETLCGQIEEFLRENGGGDEHAEGLVREINEINEINEGNEAKKMWQDHEMIRKKLPPVRIRTQAFSEDSEDDSSDFDT